MVIFLFYHLCSSEKLCTRKSPFQRRQLLIDRYLWITNMTFLHFFFFSFPNRHRSYCSLAQLVDKVNNYLWVSFLFQGQQIVHSLGSWLLINSQLMMQPTSDKTFCKHCMTALVRLNSLFVKLLSMKKLIFISLLFLPIIQLDTSILIRMANGLTREWTLFVC